MGKGHMMVLQLRGPMACCVLQWGHPMLVEHSQDKLLCPDDHLIWCLKLDSGPHRSYYLQMCENFKKNTKKLWQTINEVSGNFSDKSGIIDHITVDVIDCYQPKQIANEFGSYFGSICEKFARKIPKLVKSVSHYLGKIRLIDGLPNKASSGHNNISNLLLKEMCEPLLPA